MSPPPLPGRLIEVAHLSTGSGGEAPPSPVATPLGPAGAKVIPKTQPQKNLSENLHTSVL